MPPVVLLPAVMGIPIVGTRIVGLVDAVVGGETGVLASVKDAIALADALAQLLGDAALRKRLGDAAESRALASFDANHVNAW